MAKRLLYVTTGLSTGGAEVMMLKVLSRLDRNRFEPSVISLKRPGEIAERIAALGIPVDSLDMVPQQIGPTAIAKLVRNLRVLRPHLVHTWLYHADLVGGLAARLVGVPSVIWSIRTSTIDKRETSLSTQMVVRACAKLAKWVPDRVLSCSSAARDLHVAMGYPEAKITVVPNGFDIGQFRPSPEARASVRSELGIEGGVPLVGLIGRYHPQKNFSGFCEAAGHVLRTVPNARFVLAGSGVDGKNTQLQQLLLSNGISSAVHLLGLRADTSRIMAALDVYVSASSFGEAFPNVIGEAMACGVPCVATDVGDSAFIIGETGAKVSSGRSIELAAAVIELLRAPQSYRTNLGKLARERIAGRFEIGAIVRQYEDLYEQVCAEKSNQFKGH